jgi:hypothetical protein
MIMMAGFWEDDATGSDHEFMKHHQMYVNDKSEGK